MIAAVKQIIDNTAAQYGVASWVAEDIAQLESGGRPDAVGDHGTSFGLFQLHWGGQGTGYSAAQLKDPTLNAQIGISHMAAAYKQGVSKGLEGWNLLDYTATHSGHPGYGGVGHYPAYESALQKVYGGSGGGANSDAYHGHTPTPAQGSSLSNDNDIITQIDNILTIKDFSIAHPLESIANSAGSIGLRVMLVLLGLAIILIGTIAVIIKPFT